LRKKKKEYLDRRRRITKYLAAVKKKEMHIYFVLSASRRGECRLVKIEPGEI